MKFDPLPIFQDDRGIKNYLNTNFRRIQDLFTGAAATSEVASTSHRATHELGGTDAHAGIVPASAFAPTGLTGAVIPSRYVGATASGNPTTGTFVVGDFVIDRAGKIWICTVAGTPGTWVDVAQPIMVPHSRVYRNAAFSIPNGAVTLITWDTLYQANVNLWVSAVNPSRLTTNKAGLWLYQAAARIQGTPSNARYALWSYRNGVMVAANDTPTPPADDVDRFNSCIINCAAWDYFHSNVYVFNPGARALGTGNSSTWASLTYLGPFV